jgi:hypothetical protein
MFVNSQVSLQVQFTLPDTINQNDIMRFTFPNQTSFAYSFATSYTSNFTLNSTFIYDTVNRVLTLRQRNTAQINFAPRVISLGLTLFKAPPSIKAFSIKMELLRNSYQLASGLASLSAKLDNYTGSISAPNLKINAVTNYTILINITDEHTSKMLIEIILPSNLKTSANNTFSVESNLSTSIKPAFVFDTNNTRKLTLSNFSSQTTNYLPQTITITLVNLKNPSSVQQIGNFEIRTYYNQNSDEQVSFSNLTSTNLITTNGNFIETKIKITPNSFKNYQFTFYSFEIQI